MRILRAFGIALLTGLIGLFFAFSAAEWLTRLYHVSDFEGARAYAVVFLFAPAGFITGFVLGFFAGVVFRWPGFAGYLKSQALAIAGTVLFIGIISGISWLNSDHTPHINGKNITLEFELKIPSTIQLLAELNSHTMGVSLFASRRDYRATDINFESIATQDGFRIVPGRAILNSRSADRSLLAWCGEVSKPRK